MPATRDTLAGRPTKKEAKFAEKYVQYIGDGTKAALEVYDIKSPQKNVVACAIASENLAKKRVNEEIDRILARVDIEKIGEKEIASAIADIALQKDGKPVDKLKGLELLAKWKAMLTEKQSIETSEKEYRQGNLKEIQTNDLLTELTERLRLDNQGINTSKIKENKEEKSVSASEVKS